MDWFNQGPLDWNFGPGFFRSKNFWRLRTEIFGHREKFCGLNIDKNGILPTKWSIDLWSETRSLTVTDGHWRSMTLRLDRGDGVMDIPYVESSSVTLLNSNTSQFYPLTTERLLYEIFKSDFFFQKFNFSINDDVNWPSEDVFRRIKTVICSLHSNFWIKMANFEKILFEIIGFDR